MAGETTERAGVCDRASHVDLLLGADDVAAIRFAPDPVWETVASLGVLAHPRHHSLHGALVERVVAPTWDHYDLLMAMMASDRWCPKLLAPVPHRSETSSATRWPRSRTATRASPVGTWRCCGRANRARRAGSGRVPPADGADGERAHVVLVGRARAAVGARHRHHQRRHRLPLAFPRLRRVGSTLSGLHERITYRDGRLRLEMPGHHEHRSAGGAGVRFVPSVFRWPCLVAEPDSAPPVVSGMPRAGRVGSGRLGARRMRRGWTRCWAGCGWRSWPTWTRPAARPGWPARLRLSNGTVSEHLTAMQRAGLLSPHDGVGRCSTSAPTWGTR